MKRCSWCIYAVATVDRFLTTIDDQLKLDAAQQDKKKLEEAFAAADSFVRQLDKQLNENKRKFICGSTLVETKSDYPNCSFIIVLPVCH